jgi:hypothetical protein
MQSQETLNHSIVDNFLSFLTHPRVAYLVKPNQSYHNMQTTRKHSFWQKLETDLVSERGEN